MSEAHNYLEPADRDHENEIICQTYLNNNDNIFF